MKTPSRGVREGGGLDERMSGWVSVLCICMSVLSLQFQFPVSVSACVIEMSCVRCYVSMKTAMTMAQQQPNGNE